MGLWEALVCCHRSDPSPGQGSQSYCFQGYWLFPEYFRVLESPISRVLVLNHLFIGQGEKKHMSALLPVNYLSALSPPQGILLALK